MPEIELENLTQRRREAKRVYSANALTHVRQINLLRRMFDAPVKGKNYFKAEVEIGRVDENQSANRIEFD